MIRALAALALAQGGWLGVAALAAAGNFRLSNAVGLIATFLIVLLAPRPRPAVILAVGAGLVGPFADLVLVRAGFLEPAGQVVPFLMPTWWWGLWSMFAAGIPSTFGWLRGRVWLTALLGAVGGPLAYAAGAGIGAVALHADAWKSLVAIGALWGGLMPVLVLAAERLAAFAPPAPRSVATKEV
jgi:hypothetical protein